MTKHNKNSVNVECGCRKIYVQTYIMADHGMFDTVSTTRPIKFNPKNDGIKP